MLAVGAAAWVAHHPVFIVSPGAALLDLGLVDPEEVGEAVIAFALVEIGIELGVLSRRRRRGSLASANCFPSGVARYTTSLASQKAGALPRVISPASTSTSRLLASS